MYAYFFNCKIIYKKCKSIKQDIGTFIKVLDYFVENDII